MPKDIVKFCFCFCSCFYFSCVWCWSVAWVDSDTVEPRYNEVLGTMKITLLYQVSHYIRVKKQRNIKSWDQQNYLVIRGFCYIRPLYNEVPLYLHVHSMIWFMSGLVLQVSKRECFINLSFHFPHYTTNKESLFSILTRFLNNSSQNWPSLRQTVHQL